MMNGILKPEVCRRERFLPTGQTIDDADDVFHYSARAPQIFAGRNHLPASRDDVLEFRAAARSRGRGGSAQGIPEEALSALRRLYSAEKRGEVCSISPRLTRPERVA